MSQDVNFDAATVQRWATLAVAALAGARDRIDAANVFPVADSDTGTNLWLTISSGAAAIDPAEQDLAGAVEDFAQGALLGARGNSGIIVSELLRGMALALRGADQELWAGQRLASALRAGADAAAAAVARPAPGTMLTAAAGAALAAADATRERGVDLWTIADAATAGARDAALGSPGQLEVLARHGVLDAGAYGLALVLAALRDAFAQDDADAHEGDGSDPPVRPVPAGLPDNLVIATPGAAPRAEAAMHGHPTSDEPDGEFEVMYVVESALDDDSDVAGALRTSLEAVGESVVVVGGNGLWQVHVHTDDPAAALSAAGGAALRQVCVRHLVARPADRAALPAPAGVVAGVRSPALLAEAARSGAIVLARTDRSWTPEELGRVLEDAASRHVVALLRHDSTATLRRTLHRLPGLTVDMIVVPDDLHVVAALAAREEVLSLGGDDETALAAMRDAVGSLVWGQADSGRADAVAALLDDLVARGSTNGVGLATLLAGTRVPQPEIAAARAYLGAELSAEVVVLPSGRDDAVLRAGVL